MAIQAPHHPIIYLRGYAATMGAIEATVATPYMGFNLGSTKLRQDHGGRIIPFVFESPLVRLMKDEGYTDAFRDGDEPKPGTPMPARSVWIFRYYEESSESLGTGERRRIPGYAEQLRAFILRVRDHVCGDDAAERAKFKVNLVAHSMGGLIARCYLQNICHHGARDADGQSDAGRNVELGLTNLPVDPLVDKVFTYGTPHNGIDVAGGRFNAPDLGPLDGLHVSNFNRDDMREYLDLLDANGDERPELEGRVDTLDGKFPVERFFCFVGTNHKDYSVARKGIGGLSDGLVLIRNASVDAAPRAYAYRSHSGDYGLVNSEEGYQCLRRFLFGDVRVDVRLFVDEITYPRAIQDKIDEAAEDDDDPPDIRCAYNFEAAAKVRGGGTVLSERRVSQGSAIRRTEEHMAAGKPIHLFSGHLMKKARTDAQGGKELAFAIEIGCEVPVFEIDRSFWFDGHFEGGWLLKETVTFHVRPGADKTTVRYGLASDVGVGEANKIPDRVDLPGGGTRIEIPLGFKEGAANPPRPGLRGRMVIDALPWNE